MKRNGCRNEDNTKVQIFVKNPAILFAYDAIFLRSARTMQFRKRYIQYTIIEFQLKIILHCKNKYAIEE